MPVLSKPSAAAKTAVKFITLGALLDVWSGIWFYYMNQHAPKSDVSWYVCLGFLLTGATLVIIGLAIGQIGRAARHAELPPKEVVEAEKAALVSGAQQETPVAPVARVVSTEPVAPASTVARQL